MEEKVNCFSFYMCRKKIYHTLEKYVHDPYLFKIIYKG